MKYLLMDEEVGQRRQAFPWWWWGSSPKRERPQRWREPLPGGTETGPEHLSASTSPTKEKSEWEQREMAPQGRIEVGSIPVPTCPDGLATPEKPLRWKRVPRSDVSTLTPTLGPDDLGRFPVIRSLRFRP